MASVDSARARVLALEAELSAIYRARIDDAHSHLDSHRARILALTAEVHLHHADDDVSGLSSLADSLQTRIDGTFVESPEFAAELRARGIVELAEGWRGLSLEETEAAVQEVMLTYA